MDRALACAGMEEAVGNLADAPLIPRRNTMAEGRKHPDATRQLASGMGFGTERSLRFSPQDPILQDRRLK
jgi:hypothetical protein